MQKALRSLPKTLWAYVYEIVPPQEEDHLKAIRLLLERERADAQQTARLWTGRLVCEPHVTHILVVSDSPDLDREVNRRLESRLKELKAQVSLTVPMALADDEAQ